MWQILYHCVAGMLDNSKNKIQYSSKMNKFLKISGTNTRVLKIKEKNWKKSIFTHGH